MVGAGGQVRHGEAGVLRGGHAAALQGTARHTHRPRTRSVRPYYIRRFLSSTYKQEQGKGCLDSVQSAALKAEVDTNGTTRAAALALSVTDGLKLMLRVGGIADGCRREAAGGDVGGGQEAQEDRPCTRGTPLMWFTSIGTLMGTRARAHSFCGCGGTSCVPERARSFFHWPPFKTGLTFTCTHPLRATERTGRPAFCPVLDGSTWRPSPSHLTPPFSSLLPFPDDSGRRGVPRERHVECGLPALAPAAAPAHVRRQERQAAHGAHLPRRRQVRPFLFNIEMWKNEFRRSWRM